MAISPPDVDPAEFDGLNAEFYQADPAEAIDRRLWMLVAFLGDDAPTTGLEGELTLTRGAVPENAVRIQVAALESMLIVHQAAETLLRLCLAHWDDAPCPWFEMSKLRAPGVFRKRVAHISNTLHSDGTLDELVRIVSWSASRADVRVSDAWAREDGWSRHREGVRELVRYCCGLILDGADLYNAGKHGLAILPAEKGVSLGTDDLKMSADGPALTVIEPATHDGELRWARATHWVKYREAIAASALIATAVRSLWECGKNRRVEQGDPSRVHVFDAEVLRRILEPQEFGFHVSTYTELLFDVEHPMFSRHPQEGG